MGDPSFAVFMHGPLLDGRGMIQRSRIDETIGKNGTVLLM